MDENLDSFQVRTLQIKNNGEKDKFNLGPQIQ